MLLGPPRSPLTHTLGPYTTLVRSVAIGRERCLNECRALRRRPEGRLDRLESPPGDPEHADLAIAPQLSGDPLQGFQRIVLFLDHAKVGLHAAGVARAAHVEPHRGVAVAGKVAMDLGVADRKSTRPHSSH